MIIRFANNEDCHAIYHLHVDSIKYYCSGFYPASSIDAWLALKSPDEYKDLPSSNNIIVAEENNEIAGFSLLNIHKQSIDSLYIKPKMNGKGIGALLLKSVEEISKKNNIKNFQLSSTLNAIGFYHHMGFIGNGKSFHMLSSGVRIDCVNMTKNIT